MRTYPHNSKWMYLTENKYAQILNCVVSITKNCTSAKIVSWRANDKNSLAINCMVEFSDDGDTTSGKDTG